MESREPLNGPVPVLFAKHVERARESLKRDPSKLAKGKILHITFTITFRAKLYTLIQYDNLPGFSYKM